MEKLNIQGEPVALPDRDAMQRAYTACKYHAPHIFEAGWNSLRDEIAKLGPLYTQGDHSEVDRLTISLSKNRARINELRAQIAERDALLREVIFDLGKWSECLDTQDQVFFVGRQMTRLESAISASAEPSGPIEIDDLRIHLEAMCKLWPEDLSDDGSGRMGFKSEVAATVAKARAALVRKP